MEKKDSFLGNLISLGILILIIYFCYNYFKKDKLNENEVKIGEKIFSQKNLSTIEFSNGDPIPIVHSDEEWLSYIETQRPACRMVGDQLNSNWREEGLLYNYYALTDDRELAPDGWEIMSMDDFDYLHSKMIQSKDDFYLYHISYPSSVIIEDGSFMPIDYGAIWWCNNSKPYIVGIIEDGENIKMDQRDFAYEGGFAVRLVKKEKTFLDKIGL